MKASNSRLKEYVDGVAVSIEDSCLKANAPNIWEHIFGDSLLEGHSSRMINYNSRFAQLRGSPIAFSAVLATA